MCSVATVSHQEQWSLVVHYEEAEQFRGVLSSIFCSSISMGTAKLKNGLHFFAATNHSLIVHTVYMYALDIR